MNYTIKQLQDYSNAIDLTKKGQHHRKALLEKIIATSINHGILTLESKSDGNIGQWTESLIKALKFGYENGYYSRCNSADIKDGNGAWEIKTTSSPNSLATPSVKAQRTIFISYKGVCRISKATMLELLETQDSEYVKVTENGIRLKASAYELGTPIKWLNDVLGF